MSSIKGGGGGGFRPKILETLIIRYGLKGKARTRPDFLRVVVLGPCAQFGSKLFGGLNKKPESISFSGI